MTNHYTDLHRISGGPALVEEHHTTHNESPPVTRVQFGFPPAANAPAPSVPESTRVYGGTLKFTNGDSEASTDGGTARHQVSFDGIAGGSVMATMQRHGQHQTVELVPGQPGSRTQLSVALREGAIRQTQPGIYEDVSGRPEAIVEALNAPAAEPGPAAEEDHFDVEDEQDWGRAIEPLPQHSYDAAVASVGLAVVIGSDLTRAANDLARSSGIELAQAREYVEAGAAIHERTVARAVGLDGARKEAFYAHCREHPGPLQDAIQRLVHGRDVSGFVALSKSFNRAQPGDLSTWTAAGFETHMGSDGELHVRHGSGDWVMAKDLGK